MSYTITITSQIMCNNGFFIICLIVMRYLELYYMFHKSYNNKMKMVDSPRLKETNNCSRLPTTMILINVYSTCATKTNWLSLYKIREQ